MKEAEVAEAVVSWLNQRDWAVYQEVQFQSLGKIADIVAVKGEDVWVIECKTSFGLAVLEQASHWGAIWRSVAVPVSRSRPRTWKQVAKQFYNVGILEYDPKAFYEKDMVLEIVKPPYIESHLKSQKVMIEKLLEEHKTFAVAGTNDHSHLTPFKYSMLQIKEFVEKNGPSTIGDVIENIGHLHYASERSAKSCLPSAIRDFCKFLDVDTSKRPNTVVICEHE